MPAKVSKGEWRWAFVWAAIIVALTSLPFLLAWQLAPDGTQFTGLLINHYDGASYYAKLQQGARGDWLFHLAFTPEPHDGAFVYAMYLVLGHLAQMFGLSIPLTYHLARAAAGLFLLLVAYRFIARFLARPPARRVAFLLLGFSAGLGWLMGPLGLITADLWVAEGFTFLSIFTNPHFPLAIGLMLLIFLCALEAPSFDTGAGKQRWLTRLSVGRLGGSAILALLLSLVQPFPVPVVLVVLGVYSLLLAWRDHQVPWSQVLITGAAAAGAAPFVLYDLFVYRTNPALAAWSAQNVTPSLPPWSYILGYGLVLLAALAGLWAAARRRSTIDLFLLSWAGSVAVLLYVPFALQRRFIIGFHVPVVLLATIGLEQIVLPRLQPRRWTLLIYLFICLTAVTSLFVPLISVAGVAQGQRPLVMTQDEADALAWLRENTEWTDTVLTPIESGEFVPAWAGNRVVYGHPFETIDAETKRAQVSHFYSAEATSADRREMLADYGVRYVLVEKSASHLDPAALGLTPIWSGREAVLYRLEEAP